MAQQTHGFWSRGKEEYLRQLDEEEKEQLDSLRRALQDAADSAVKQEIAEKIEAVRAEFRAGRNEVRSSFFAH